MESEVVTGLNQLLGRKKASTGFRKAEINQFGDILIEEGFLTKSFRGPKRCLQEGCRANCTVIKENRTIRVVCDLEDEPHETIASAQDWTFYDLHFESILESIARYIGSSISDGSIENRTMPKYLSCLTEDGLKIVLLVSPANIQRAVTEIYSDTIRENVPTLLVTAESRIDPLLELQSVFSTGSLVYTVPLQSFSYEPEYVRKPIDTLLDIHDIENKFLAHRFDDDPDRLITRVNSNPRYILSELNHMRLLRKNKELPQSSGTRLENAAEVALSQLFPALPGAGGEEDRGASVPDRLFYIPEDKDTKADSILGVIDTKSGDTANFGSEEAKGKHDEYLELAQRSSINADWVAHTFIVLEFDGQQELEFHQKMSEFYRDNDFMLVITADALAILLSAYLSASVSNELQLIHGDFRSATYPLFNPEKFQDTGLKAIERPVGQNPEKYRDEYLMRHDLVILHRGVVQRHFENCLESPKEIERIFELYFESLPAI